MSRNVTAIEASAARPRTTFSSACILDSITDKRPEQVGSYAGWGTGDDAHAPATPEAPPGPAMMPFLRHRPTDSWWRLSLWLLWLPSIVVVITVEDWIHLSQSIMWISLGVLFVAYLSIVFLVDRRPS